MITILKSTESRLQPVDEITDGSWLNVIAPSGDEVARLHQELGIPRDFLTYPLDVDERARTEREDSATLIILRIPYSQGESADIPYITVPLGIVLADRVIVTVCRTENSITEGLVAGRATDTVGESKGKLVRELGSAKYLFGSTPTYGGPARGGSAYEGQEWQDTLDNRHHPICRHGDSDSSWLVTTVSSAGDSRPGPLPCGLGWSCHGTGTGGKENRNPRPSQALDLGQKRERRVTNRKAHSNRWLGFRGC